MLAEPITWEDYEKLLAGFEERPAVRLAYDRGHLEIAVTSAKHEHPNSLLSTVIREFADALGLEYYELRSVTLKREDLDRGIEPDACFYFERSATIDPETGIDLAVSPPPDLAVEIDVSNISLNKLPIYEALGVAELWRWQDRTLTVYLLENGIYRESPVSLVLPGLRAHEVTTLLARLTTSRRWHRDIRQWAESRATA